MKIRNVVAFLLLALVLVASSCTSFQISGIQVVAQETEYTTVGDFELNVSVMEFMGAPAGVNLVNISATDMDEEIMSAIKAEIASQGGDAAVNVKIVYMATVGNMIVGSVTGNILAPATAVITGTIVKF